MPRALLKMKFTDRSNLEYKMQWGFMQKIEKKKTTQDTRSCPIENVVVEVVVVAAIVYSRGLCWEELNLPQ